MSPDPSPPRPRRSQGAHVSGSQARVDQVDDAFSEALGHIRNATEALADEHTSESMLLGLSCVDLQHTLGDVWPAWIPNERTASESLACAASALAEVIDYVPLAVWAALESLRRQVDDGHR